VADPVSFWRKYRNSLAEDVRRKIAREGGESDNKQGMDLMFNKCLVLLEDLVFSMSGQFLQQYGLTPSIELEAAIENRECLRELSYDVVQLSEAIAVNVPEFNEEQRKVYEKITANIDSEAGMLFFLDALGGTGKT
jgi:hypothetical protein